MRLTMISCIQSPNILVRPLFCCLSGAQLAVLSKHEGNWWWVILQIVCIEVLPMTSWSTLITSNSFSHVSVYFSLCVPYLYIAWRTGSDISQFRSHFSDWSGWAAGHHFVQVPRGWGSVSTTKVPQPNCSSHLSALIFLPSRSSNTSYRCIVVIRLKLLNLVTRPRDPHDLHSDLGPSL